MADIFVSYTSSDRQWAEWIGHELIRLGHAPHLHDWELSAGGDIVAWMEKRHQEANHVLCVVSENYLQAPYSSWERRAAQWAAATDRPNFALPVFVEDCKSSTLFAHIKRCDLFRAGDDAEAARERLEAFLKPAQRSAAQPSFPGRAAIAVETPSAAPAFPGKPVAQSNISITVPEHFLGRDADMTALESALARYEGRVAITALHGLRGVGKTTLAAAYAEKHRGDYRATWWLRAQGESTLRADLVGLGVRLAWVSPDAKEEAAVGAVLERLRVEGGGILLIYDNAIDADSLRPYLPKGGAAKIIVTSNAHNWRGLASPVEIRLWPKEIGADFLIARTGQKDRAAAEALSAALHGLPLAHEQAAAYCERLEVGLADYLARFTAKPARLLDAEKDAPAEYHDKLTVAKTFALAIDEAGEIDAAAISLIECAALLEPEPIPFFFLEELWPRMEATPQPSLRAEGEAIQESRAAPGLPRRFAPRNDGGEAPVGEQLEEAVAALRRFALVDVDEIEDERDPDIKTKTLRLHRLVRFVAGERLQGEAREAARRGLIEAMAAVYPREVYDDPKCWPRARRLDALALALVEKDAPPKGAESEALFVLAVLAQYRQAVFGAYRAVRSLFENALALAEQIYPPDHVEIATALVALGNLLRNVGGAENLENARAYLIRALPIDEKALGPEHPSVAIDLSNLALVLNDLGGAENLEQARAHLARALAIDEKALGSEHPSVAIDLSNLALVLKDFGGTENLEQARAHLSRALAIHEKALGPEHPSVAIDLSNLALVLKDLGGAENLEQARAHDARALAIDEKALGPEHPSVAIDLSNLAMVLKVLGGSENLAQASAHLSRALAIDEKALEPEHPYVGIDLSNLAAVLADIGGADNIARARENFIRAEKILRQSLGDEHPRTQRVAADFARFRAEHGEG
ncbi:MAG: tetratricopeptide repeat protein [Methylocystis sp.]